MELQITTKISNKCLQSKILYGWDSDFTKQLKTFQNCSKKFCKKNKINKLNKSPFVYYIHSVVQDQQQQQHRDNNNTRLMWLYKMAQTVIDVFPIKVCQLWAINKHNKRLWVSLCVWVFMWIVANLVIKQKQKKRRRRRR